MAEPAARAPRPAGPAAPRPVALVDCASFFASCEVSIRPELRGRPVVVLSNNDGCVIAANAHAKAHGLRRGDPLFKVRALLRRIGAHIASADFELYADLSGRVMDLLHEAASDVQVYSIDEAFVRPPPVGREGLIGWAEATRADVWRGLGIGVRIGVAPTRTLAKIAGEQARETQRRVAVWQPEHAREVLGAIPPRGVWGVNRRMEARLVRLGVRTALDLRDADTYWLRRHGGVTLLRTALELRGQPCSDLRVAPAHRHSATFSRSFGRLVRTRREMREVLATYAAQALAKVRRAGQKAGGLYVWMRPHARGQRLTSRGASLRLPAPSVYPPDICAAADRIIDALWQQGTAYEKAGITLFDLSADDDQTSLFDPDAGARKAVVRAVDAVNARWGVDTVRFARAARVGRRQGAEVRPSWWMKNRYRTPSLYLPFGPPGPASLGGG